MKIFDDLFSFLFSLDTKKFTIYLASIVSGIVVIAVILLFLFNRKSNDLLSQIKTMQKLSEESRSLLFTYETIQERKKEVFDTIEHDKNFDLKSFFATFCKENNLKPESTWSTIEDTVENNELLEEITLPVVFHNFSMQNLIQFIEALEKKERVYIKSLTITREALPSKLLACSLTLATLKYRSESGE